MRSSILIFALAIGLSSTLGPPGLAAQRLTAAAPATAQAGGLRGRLDPSASDQSPVDVTGSAAAAVAGVAPGAPAASPQPIASPIPPAPTAADSSQAASDCRQACAHSYYFCLAGDETGTCPDGWRQCLADCRQPAQAASPPSP